MSWAPSLFTSAATTDAALPCAKFVQAIVRERSTAPVRPSTSYTTGSPLALLTSSITVGGALTPWVWAIAGAAIVLPANTGETHSR